MKKLSAKSYQAILDSPIGKLGIKSADNKLTAVDFLPANTAQHAPETAFAASVIGQLDQYFQNPKFIFDLPIELHGTTHQLKVWQALRKIPAGKTRTYGELARIIGSAPRAIGGACSRVPTPIVIPCHRVVAATNLGGYSGETRGRFLDIKKWLLAHES